MHNYQGISLELIAKYLFGGSGNGVAGPVFEFLLFALVPSGHICKIACHTGDLRYIMTTAIRTNWLATEGTVFNSLGDIVGAVTVVERAHDHKMRLTAAGAWVLINNVVTGVALVSALFNRNIFKSGVFLFKAELFCRPVHGIILIDRNDKIIGVAIRKIYDLCGNISIRSFAVICVSISGSSSGLCSEERNTSRISCNPGRLEEKNGMKNACASGDS